MDEWRRRSYLSAMGVRVWESRVPRVDMAASLEWTPGAADPGAPTDPDPIGATAKAPVEGLDAVTAAGLPVETPATPMGDWRDSQDPGSALSRDSDVETDAVERMDWESLESAVAGCRACGLCEGRNRTVFGIGDRAADLMLIGEAPGADEDRLGEPFVGRAGQLLDRMLEAIGLSREQVYIANVLKCRPPGNRDPRPEEALQCQGYLRRQIALVQPRLILSVGRVSAQQLLKTDTAVGRLRGRWFEEGPGGVPLRVTYHPAYLLRSPEQKAQAWKDLTAVRRRLDELTAVPDGTRRPA